MTSAFDAGTHAWCFAEPTMHDVLDSLTLSPR